LYFPRELLMSFLIIVIISCSSRQYVTDHLLNFPTPGGFVLVDGKDYTVKGRWEKQSTKFGYDFWYQPRHNVMISSEWGEPNTFITGYSPQDVADGMSTQLTSWKS
jgi:hypothetical protein